VFGPKQSPDGAYAAVIPLFMQALKDQQSPKINGDGEQTRDFTYIDNVVQANVKGFFASEKAKNQVFNIACGERLTINYLWNSLKNSANSKVEAVHGPNRQGDVRDSLADISKAKELLGYEPQFTVREGLGITWDSFK
jgi:UDP-N-acetylglucosamine 4-epimerase